MWKQTNFSFYSFLCEFEIHFCVEESKTRWYNRETEYQDRCTAMLQAGTTSFYYLPQRCAPTEIHRAVSVNMQVKLHCFIHRSRISSSNTQYNMLIGWLSGNIISLNAGKTSFMAFGRANAINDFDQLLVVTSMTM